MSFDPTAEPIASRPRFAASVRRACAFAVLGGLLAVHAATGQTPSVSTQFGERLEVEVVDVDVVVTDRSGHPVFGLGREAFEIRVDGRPVPVDYFAPPRSATASTADLRTSGASSAAIAPEPVAAAPSYLAVFVDQAALSSRLRATAVAELREFLRRRPGDEVVIVAAFEKRLHLLAPPSADPAAIEAGLNALARLPVGSALAASERRHLDSRIRGVGAGWVGADTGLALAQREASLLEVEVRRWAEEELDLQRRSLAALKQFVGALGALEGRKSVILASGGTTTEGAEGLLTELSRRRLGPNELPSLFDAKQKVREQFEEVIRVAQDARVALYALHPPDTTMLQYGAELSSPGDGPIPLPRDPAIVDAAASAARMAGATGGRTYLLGTNLDSRLASVRSDAESVYSLGFGTGPEMGDGDHRIEVRVAGQRLRLRHRTSFRRRTTAEQAESALYAAATLGELQNALGLEVETGAARPVGDARGDRVISFAARVPLASLALLPEEGVRRGRLAVRVALLSERGELFTSQSLSVPVEIAEPEVETMLERPWVHRAEVRVTPSTRRLAILVVDEIAGVFATATTAVGPADPD